MQLYLKENLEIDLKMTSPDALYAIGKELENADQEVLMVVTLNAVNKIIRRDLVSMGGVDRSVVDVKILFRRVLMAGGPKFAVIHNHPSGEIEPSKNDNNFTKRLKKAAELLTLDFLDHIIVGSNGKYYSYAREGKM